MAADFYKELGVSRTRERRRDQKGVPQARLPASPGQESRGQEDRDAIQGRQPAYQALSDKEKRKLYDEFGEEGAARGLQLPMRRAPTAAGACLAALGGAARGGGPSASRTCSRAPAAPKDRAASAICSGICSAAAARRGASPGMKGSDIASEVSRRFHLRAARGRAQASPARRR